MDEGDAGSASADAGGAVDQAGTFGLEVAQGGIDVGDGDGDVVDALAALTEEPSHRPVTVEGLEELDEGASQREHGLLDALLGDNLAVGDSDAVEGPETSHRLVEVGDGDPHMVQVVGQHPAIIAERGESWFQTTTSADTRYTLPMANPVICSVARTPIGRFQGAFVPLTAMDLGGAAIAAALDRSGLAAVDVDEVLFGHVLQAGQGQITARQAAVKGGVPMTVPATTINKVCLSGLTAIAEASRHIRLGEATFVVAGGMESMSHAPCVLNGARQGLRVGDATLVDTMTHDGLWCAFDECTMGESSDRKNAQLGIERSAQDAWAAESHRRAAEATAAGAFAGEITPVAVPQRKGDPVLVEADEGIRSGTTAESLAALRPAFAAAGTITAGNASQVSDGAAAVVVADRSAAEAAGLPVLAEILAYGQTAGPDASLHERPAEAVRVALKRTDLSVDDIDLFEINEAFAAVALWSAQMLDVPADRVNVHGGAVALGHPLGATGARLVVTLVNALRRRGGGIGAAALCGGGGQGDALVLSVPGGAA